LVFIHCQTAEILSLYVNELGVFESLTIDINYSSDSNVNVDPNYENSDCATYGGSEQESDLYDSDSNKTLVECSSNPDTIAENQDLDWEFSDNDSGYEGDVEREQEQEPEPAPANDKTVGASTSANSEQSPEPDFNSKKTSTNSEQSPEPDFNSKKTVEDSTTKSSTSSTSKNCMSFILLRLRFGSKFRLSEQIIIFSIFALFIKYFSHIISLLV